MIFFLEVTTAGRVDHLLEVSRREGVTALPRDQVLFDVSLGAYGRSWKSRAISLLKILVVVTKLQSKSITL